MRKEWKYFQLDDAVTKGSSNVSLNKVNDEDGDFPLFGAQGFVQNVSFFQQEKEYLAVIKDGAGIGRISKHPPKSSVLATMQYIIPKDGFNIDFIKYFLEGIDFEKFRNGSTIPHIYFKDYKNVAFPNLPLPEQLRIVAILDKAFAAIAKAKANAEQNLQNAKALFESYLQSVFEKKGEGWEEKKLCEIGLAQTGTTPKTSEKENFGDFIPFIKPADVDFKGSGNIRYEKDGLSEIGLKKGRKMESGSVLMVCIGATIGKVGFSEKVVSCNQQINSLTVKEVFEAKFFYYGMTTNSFQEKVLSAGKSAQATLPIINKSKWEHLTLNFPKSKTDQQSIVRRLDALRAETRKLERIYRQKIDNLDELKKRILEKAFRGELKTEINQ